MTNEKQSLTDYYAEKNKVRFMMVTSKEHKAELNRICKIHGVSQGALLEVFLDMYPSLNKDSFNDFAKGKQEAKKAGRVSVSAVSKKIKGMSREELEAIEQFIEEQKAKADEKAGIVPVDPPGDFS